MAHAAWVWGVARAAGARVLVRIEDHDRGRCRPAYERDVLDALGWLGLAPDDDSLDQLRAGPTPFRQSDAGAEYEAALARLAARGLVYGCDCSRSTIARELGDGVVEGEEMTYPGTCRDRGLVPGPGVGTRVRFPDDVVGFEDLRLGPARQRPARQCGDLLLRDRHGNWTYQFAVTVDDWRQGVTLVVRGEDLLTSTGRQILLARLLGRDAPPRFLHHPLIRNADGVKLSKRDGAMGLDTLRQAGRPADQLIGEALAGTGVIPAPRPVAPDALGEVFRPLLESMPPLRPAAAPG